MDPPTRSEHHLVIVRRAAGLAEPAVLLVEGGERPALPRLESEEHRSADVGDLTRAVLGSLGLEVSVLRCLADEPGDAGRPRRHLYTLEAHAPGDGAPPRARWVSRAELGPALPDDPALRDPLEAWRSGAPRRAGAEAPDWEQPGWRDRALAWVAGELARRHRAPVQAIEQVRAWEFSQVLRLTTAEGALYFKARPGSGAAEAPLTRRLADRHPRWLPEVIAIERERRWLLMRATAGPELMEVRDPARWEAAAAAMARVQIDWLDRTDDLVALGCRRRTLAALEAEIAPLLHDGAALQPAVADGLTDAEVADLRRRGPELAALCRELDRAAVPASLEHGDLWGVNVIAGPDAPVLIDWEDASVAHPFISPSLLLLSLEHTEALAGVPDARHRIREAYLRPWAERGPLAGWPAARLERAFDLAQRVALLHYAVQFRLGLPRVETSWEVRAFAPLFLRRLLAAS